MPEEPQNNPIHPPAQSGGRGSTPSKITPEIVAAVADKVYAMLLRDLRLDFERQRWMRKSSSRSMGGKG